MEEFRKRVEEIILDHCKGIGWLEFGAHHLPQMLDQIEEEARKAFANYPTPKPHPDESLFTGIYAYASREPHDSSMPTYPIIPERIKDAYDKAQKIVAEAIKRKRSLYEDPVLEDFPL